MPWTPPLWQRGFFLVNCWVSRCLLASVSNGVVKIFRYVPQVLGDPVNYTGPIDIDSLVDLDSLADRGASHWTFLAFPASTVTDHGVPADSDAQQYIAAVQSAGVPIGIWCNSPVDGTAYAAVSHDTIPKLLAAIKTLTQFTDSFAADLSERLFRESEEGDK